MLAHGPQTGIGYKRDDGDFFTLPQWKYVEQEILFFLKKI